ncbi:MAG: GEVED domain-containing protein [Granulosicoccaceae bacterium]
MLHANSQPYDIGACYGLPSAFRWLYCLLILCLGGFLQPAIAADTVFNYSSAGQIRGVNLTLGVDNLLTTSPNTNSVNALASNADAGLIYYGSGSRIYYWNPVEGSGAGAHHFLHDFNTGSPSAPIQNINSTAGTYLDGRYYVGSESAAGYIEELYEIQMSANGTQVISVRALNLLNACNCSGVQIGGFGDVSARFEGGSVVIYGSTADISGNGSGASAGRWRFEPNANNWTLLATGSGGQMSNSPSGTLYTNINNSIRTFDPVSGQAGATNLLTTSVAIWDFTSGFNLDFGDAPDSYGSAYHRMPATQSPPFYLGQTPPDNEPYSLNNSIGGSNGVGDDNTGSLDEDAVSSLQSINVGASDYTLSVQCSAGAYVSAWIDANVNGVFDAGERNANHPLACSSSASTLVWSGIGLNQAGTSMVRIRTSSNVASISTPIGLAPDGEVEDHAVNIVEPVVGSCPAGSTSTIYAATGLTLPIGPNANQITRSTLTVPQPAVISDVNLRNVIGTHSYINDLVFTLDFNGERQGLYGPACNGRNDFSIGFNDQASGTPPCPPVDGKVYPPVGSLAAYNGMDAQGVWTLEILDRYNRDGGQLQSWELELCTLAPVTNPDIRMAKNATVNSSEVEFSLRVVNTGDVVLNDISVQDNLDSTFGVGNYSVLQAPQIVSAPSGFVVNTVYDGSSNADLLSASGVLAVQEELILTIFVSVQNVLATDGQYLNQANVLARDIAGTTISDLSGDGTDISVDLDTPTPFQLSTDITIGGVVFIDSSSSSITSHDGILQTTEIGLSNRLVTVTDVSGNVLSTALSDGAGGWAMQIASALLGSELTVSVSPLPGSVFISESPNHASGLLNDGEFVIQSLASTGYNDLDFGLINLPTLTSGQSLSANAGTSIKFAHRYSASTSGLVNFTLSDVSGWTAALYDDANCDGQIDGGDAVVTADVVVSKGQQLCLVIDAFIPASAVSGRRQQFGLIAVLTASDEANTGHSVSISLDNSDSVTVAAATSGRLVLTKNVLNVTQNGAPLSDNAASPGDTIEYTIAYSNQGTGPLTQLEINDETPAFTNLLPGTIDCGPAVGGVQCTSSVSSSGVKWVFTGSIKAGAGGNVSYRVTVD